MSETILAVWVVGVIEMEWLASTEFLRGATRVDLSDHLYEVIQNVLDFGLWSLLIAFADSIHDGLGIHVNTK